MRVPVKQFLISVKQWGSVFILFDGEAKLCYWIYEEGEIIGARVTVDNGKRRFGAVVPIEWVYVEKKGGQSVRADAVIDDDLDDESADHPAQVTQRTRSQVYSIRVPVERLEQLRCLAKERGMAPTAMLREWVLTQLDAEIGA